MDFHGQHENQKLLNATTHLQVLDNFVDRKIIDKYKKTYFIYSDKKIELEEMWALINRCAKEMAEEKKIPPKEVRLSELKDWMDEKKIPLSKTAPQI